MGILNKLIGSAVILSGMLLTGCEGMKWFDFESSESASYYGAYPSDQYNSYREYRQAMDKGQHHGNSSNFDKVYTPPKYYNTGGNSSVSVSPSQYCTMVDGKCCYENTCTASCGVNPWCGGAKKKTETPKIDGDSEYKNNLKNDLEQGY